MSNKSSIFSIEIYCCEESKLLMHKVPYEPAPYGYFSFLNRRYCELSGCFINFFPSRKYIFGKYVKLAQISVLFC